MSTLPTVPDCSILPRTSLQRGTTILSKTFTFANDDGPLVITAARFSYSHGVDVIYTVAGTVAGGVVTRPEIPDTVTETWPKLVEWDLKILREGDIARRYIASSYAVGNTSQPVGVPIL